MRKIFPTIIIDKLAEGFPIYTLLGDIGVHSFNSVFNNYPDRIQNMGVMEQSMIGIAAGLALAGEIPVVHTIAPFLVERAYEQLKVDFGYQCLNGNFVSVGASFDYSGLGATHHCPADVNLITSIPNFEVVVPGNSTEFKTLFNDSFDNQKPTYFRLTEGQHSLDLNVRMGRANKIKNGDKLTIIVIGDMLDLAIEASADSNVSVLYFSCIKPFDYRSIADCSNTKFLIVAPFYTAALESLVREACTGKSIMIDVFSPPVKFIHKYGTYDEMKSNLGFTVKHLKNKIEQLIKK